MRVGESANGGADFAGDGGVEGRGGLVEQQQARLVEHGFGQSDAGLLAGGENAAFGVAKMQKVEISQDGFDALAQMRHGIEHAEDAQVLRDGEIARQRRVDRGEVGAAQRLAPAFGQIATVNGDGSGGGLEHAQDHIDGGRFARAVGAEEAEDFMRANGEGKTIDGAEFAVLFAEMGDRKDRCGHLEVQRSAVSGQKGPSPSWPRPGIGARPE